VAVNLAYTAKAVHNINAVYNLTFEFPHIWIFRPPAAIDNCWAIFSMLDSLTRMSSDLIEVLASYDDTDLFHRRIKISGII